MERRESSSIEGSSDATFSSSESGFARFLVAVFVLVVACVALFGAGFDFRPFAVELLVVFFGAGLVCAFH